MAIFTPDIPQAKNQRNADRVLMIQNFNAVSDFMQKNHGNFNTGSQGFHKWVTLLNHDNSIGTMPNVSTGITNALISGIQHLAIWNKDSLGVAFNYSLTRAFPGSTGSTQLTNSFKLKWGTVTLSASEVNVRVTFPTTNQLEFLTECLIVLPIVLNSTNSDTNTWVTLISVDRLGFDIWQSERTTLSVSSGITIIYIALGF